MMEPNSDILLKLAHYSQETKRLEGACSHLQQQFYELKEKHEASHQTLEQIVAHMSDGLMFVSNNGIVTLFNPAAAELTGLSKEVVLHTSFWDHFSDRVFGFSMEEALKKPTGHRRIFLTLGASQEVEVSTSSVPEKGVLLLLCNRTEQQKLQKSLSQGERLQELGEMAATLAHEIRNPLGGIEGFAQLLKRDLEAPSHQRMIQAILEGTRILNRLVTNVLDYARPMQLHFAPANLVTLVEETLNLSSAAAHGGTCHFKSAHPTYAISMDQERIKLVLLNLLRNAFEAGAQRVDILLTNEGALVVQDDGEGISQDNLDKIFTPFFTTKMRGTGLGLAQALAVIKAHDGTLEVASEQGKGTQFILKLPK